MRTRVAAVVTLLIVALLGVLLVQSSSYLANKENKQYHDGITVICQATGATLEGETPESRVAVLRANAAIERDTFRGYFMADGSAVYTSNSSALPLAEEDMQNANANAVSVYNRQNAEGKEAFYAIYQFDDGAFLLYARKEATGLDVLLGNRMMLGFAVLTLGLLVYVLVIISANARKEALVRQTMVALDAFSEGRFDTRIEPLRGKNQEISIYNAIIGRIQDRVLKQASRNHAMSIVMNQMQNGIIAVDESQKVMLITPVAKKLLGIIGNPEGRLVSDASKDVKLDDVFNEAMRQDGVYTNEVAARTATGRGHRPLRLYVSPMRNDGKVVGALAMVEDITEIRRLEQVRTDFAANVSHELKTPLTSIRGFVETLENGAIDNPEMAHKFLRIIMLETERLTRLINDILSISKLESGDNEVSVERLRLDKMAYDVADMLSIHAGEKEVTVNCHMNKEPVNIMGNSDRVEQMLINLIENGIKYNKPGGSVTVQVFSNGVEANIAISDTGIGIAEENLPRLFERFYRVDKGRSRQMGGTGLGLAIVKHIIRTMGGEIEVHSKLGEGTEFLITLPLAPKDDPDKDTIFNDDN
ncbi:MAG: PAS domain S-box protein [Clostridia bacterium]|nr:PAS domain S-box protein [Clostridia bacterium]